MKSGTTTLGHLLGHHPQIAIPPNELGFFSKPHNFEKGYAFYESLVAPYITENTVIRGEKTPYSYRKHLTREIHKYNPNLKCLFILRDPVKRAWSNYCHDLYNLDEWRSFRSCIKQESKRSPLQQYLSKGLYADQIENYRKYFPEENIHVVLFEDLLSNKEVVLTGIFNFLGVDPLLYEQLKPVHSKKSKQPSISPILLIWYKKLFAPKGMVWNALYRFHFRNDGSNPIPEKEKQLLTSFYKEPNAKLSRLLQRDLSAWE